MKNKNFKNSRVSFVELYLRINHVIFYIDWIIFQRLVAILVLKKNLEITAFKVTADDFQPFLHEKRMKNRYDKYGIRIQKKSIKSIH